MNDTPTSTVRPTLAKRPHRRRPFGPVVALLLGGLGAACSFSTSRPLPPAPGVAFAACPAALHAPAAPVAARFGAQPDTLRYLPLATGYDELVRRYRTWRRVRAADPSLALGVLVVDETVSKLGGDFYRLFYEHWTPPNVQGHYTVAVREQPLPNRGTRVEVRVDDRVAARFHLQPRLEHIEQAARYAAARVARFLEIGAGRLVVE